EEHAHVVGDVVGDGEVRPTVAVEVARGHGFRVRAGGVADGREEARQRAVLQGFEKQPGGPQPSGRPPRRGAGGTGFSRVEHRAEPHGHLLFGRGLLKNGSGPPGAQTERRGGAGPVRGLPGGKEPTGRLRCLVVVRPLQRTMNYLPFSSNSAISFMKSSRGRSVSRSGSFLSCPTFL